MKNHRRRLNVDGNSFQIELPFFSTLFDARSLAPCAYADRTHRSRVLFSDREEGKSLAASNKVRNRFDRLQSLSLSSRPPPPLLTQTTTTTTDQTNKIISVQARRHGPRGHLPLRVGRQHAPRHGRGLRRARPPDELPRRRDERAPCEGARGPLGGHAAPLRPAAGAASAGGG